MIGQAFCGAVMSEQAARMAEAMTAVAMRRRRRIIGVTPDKKGMGLLRN